MSSGSFAQRLAVKGALPRLTTGTADTINIGFVAPLTGPVQSWGLPGLNGCQIWADRIGRKGGLQLGGRRHNIRILPYDCRYDPKLAREGVRKLVQEHDVKLILSLGGDTLSAVMDYLTDRKILTATLLPSDLSPDTPYLIAPSELHPIYNVTGVDWLSRSRPEIRRVALCSQTDALGLPSLATYRAAFDAAGIEVVKEIRYDPDAADAGAIVAAMLADHPDMLCWCTSYTPMVHALTEAAHAAGFTGQLLSCTLDAYPRLVARTSRTFMEGFVFQFPDFDDPALAEKAFFFNRPKDFYDEYQRRFPDSWSAVSWEYAAILDIWHTAAERAGSVTSISVLAAMKQSGAVMHAFGPAAWWGAEIFGIDNALVGDWPVVRLTDGKARIVEFGSIPDWLAEHGPRLKAQMIELGQMWDQRQARAGSKTALARRSL
ncbi:ABC transporter substrate-binding protein [Defluviimonas sp. WL0024]|uniref:ABC transporter substrate-binding protein n=1 Tax=Albidovulum salinarum TaxID=2984153 RepID=A0ABT2X0U0_9RHOB|nr:ABC transporter substrate-binding protein [Defluviimonas sp. WL0024]MCU9847536.1 ABC transporter substrate-binding protein [Defluviimonas sp. WL0024]